MGAGHLACFQCYPTLIIHRCGKAIWEGGTERTNAHHQSHITLSRGVIRYVAVCVCWLCVGCGVQTTVFSKFLPQGFSKSTASRNYGACPNPTTRLNRGHACKRYQTMSKRERERFAKAQKMHLGIGETFARSFVEVCHSVL